MGSFQRLEAEAVKSTVDRLERRISARFPGRNLRLVAADLARTVDEVAIRPQSPWYQILRVASRIVMGLLGVVLVVGVVLVIQQSAAQQSPDSIWAWIQILESTINDIVFAGIAMYFLWHLPERVQRSHDLAALYRLRSLAHVIDMHQLSKDPDRLSPDFRRTEASLEMGLTRSQLGNYLDYCTELLSLVSKTSALFAEHSNDPTVLATVDAIEDLTTGLSRKIWQKIALLQATRPADI